MIRDNDVVLVLGAGASFPYGFPLGEPLIEEIRTLDDPEVGRFLEVAPDFTRDHTVEFLSVLQQSGQRSIDRFLQHRREYSNVGKAMIAFRLMRHESTKTLRTPGTGRWYRYFYSDILAPSGPEDFNNNCLGIITYNYDRSLEKFFFDTLKADFALSDDKASKAAQSIPIVHVHGSFGDLPGMGDNVRHYNTDFSGIDSAMNRLHVVSDDIEASGVIDSYGRLLEGASHIVFLGFGYDSVNIKRLRLNVYSPNARVYGTAFGMEYSEMNLIQKNYFGGKGPSLEWDHDRVDCLNFLRKNRQYFV